MKPLQGLVKGALGFALAALSGALAPNLRADPPGSIDPDYFDALRHGDIRQLQWVLDRGAPVNARDARGNTALMLAALYGDVSNLRLLIQRGADVNASNQAGATPLMRAAGDPRKMRLLIKRGADVNARSAAGNTPLILAARPAGSHVAVQLLLEHEANAGASNHFGATALMAAAAGGDVESVRLLLRHGANPNALPGMDHTGFLFGGGRTPLMWAAFRGKVEMINLLIDAGADVNQTGLLGSPLSQAVWADRRNAVEWLIGAGARTETGGMTDGYTALHWAASSPDSDPALVRLLLGHGAHPNLGGGEPIDAFMGVSQTPLMLARRNGNDAIAQVLLAAGATNAPPDRVRSPEYRRQPVPASLDADTLRAAIGDAMVPLQATSLESKTAFLNHASRQDCTSCHQQHLPMAATGLARKFGARVDAADEQALIRLVREGAIKDPEIDEQPLFHPDAVMTKGYELFAYAGEDLPADGQSDAWVHHLAAIQGPEGQWYNNLPRPPIQTGDMGATALAIHALQKYPLPGRAAEFADRVAHARRWLWTAKAEDTDSLSYQLLGLWWAGETRPKLQSLANALAALQRDDGGWGQSPGLPTDAYATGQALYALRLAGGLKRSDEHIDRGFRFLLGTQCKDGTWYVRRRAFPFQPTMKSGFPYGRDSWISAAGTSWAVMAMSLPDDPQDFAGLRSGQSAAP